MVGRTAVLALLLGVGCLEHSAYEPEIDALCGNLVVDEGERCDGNCPLVCYDGGACTSDTLYGGVDTCDAVCGFAIIPRDECVDGDGCCPLNCVTSNDSDCSSFCGNDVVDGLETCDGNCPIACDDRNSCSVDALAGHPDSCSAACSFSPVINCDGSGASTSDGCCPAGCTNRNDPDCSPFCGNGQVDEGETCDGENCPTTCDDGSACTLDVLVGSAVTCGASCIIQPITVCADGDGCCPGPCTPATDSDCSTTCGDGTVDDGETCDGDCPTPCPSDEPNCPPPCDDGNACTVDFLVGSDVRCSAECVTLPVIQCVSGDGCCPPGCDSPGYLRDQDCSCGNGRKEGWEDCDDTDVGTAECTDFLGLDGGILGCTAACTFDFSSCTGCGNGSVETGEECDGTDFDGLACADFPPYDDGTLSCDGSCNRGYASCTECGDGVAEGNEACDDSDLPAGGCASISPFDDGTLSCDGSCQLDTSACTNCGDDTAEGAEACDGSDLRGLGCANVAPFDDGTLSCDGSCQLDTSACTECGDGAAEGDEECDTDDLKGLNCADFPPFDDGVLGCDACAYDTSACTDCGDGVPEGNEQCDDGDQDDTDECRNDCTLPPGPPACAAPAARSGLLQRGILVAADGETQTYSTTLIAAEPATGFVPMSAATNVGTFDLLSDGTFSYTQSGATGLTNQEVGIQITTASATLDDCIIIHHKALSDANITTLSGGTDMAQAINWSFGTPGPSTSGFIPKGTPGTLGTPSTYGELYVATQAQVTTTDSAQPALNVVQSAIVGGQVIGDGLFLSGTVAGHIRRLGFSGAIALVGPTEVETLDGTLGAPNLDLGWDRLTVTGVVELYNVTLTTSQVTAALDFHDQVTLQVAAGTWTAGSIVARGSPVSITFPSAPSSPHRVIVRSDTAQDLTLPIAADVTADGIGALNIQIASTWESLTVDRPVTVQNGTLKINGNVTFLPGFSTDTPSAWEINQLFCDDSQHSDTTLCETLGM